LFFVCNKKRKFAVIHFRRGERRRVGDGGGGAEVRYRKRASGDKRREEGKGRRAKNRGEGIEIIEGKGEGDEVE
jgi:hypothetical protein